MSSRRVLASALAACLLAGVVPLATACAPDRGRVLDAGAPAVSEVHSDSDGIPDHIEAQLGTDHENHDSDFDGLSDYYELVVLPKQRAQSSARPGLTLGTERAYAADPPASGDATGAGEYAEHDWQSIDVDDLHDSNGDGIHEALDPYGPNVQVSLDATLTGRIHSAISKANGWDWSASIPTAKQYNDAFVALMMDEANTPAPLVANDQRVVAPDIADPLTEDKATAAWKGRTYEAKIPVWKLDDAEHGGDGDGIPTGYEAYGYVWKGSRFEPWGFAVSGKSSYTPPSVGFEIVGNALTPLDQKQRDYTEQYFLTDPTQVSSDADPYSDKLESTGANIPQNVKAPADRPSVAAFPSIVGYLKSAKVTMVEDITTTEGKKVTKGSASATILTSDAVPKLAISALFPGEGMLASAAGQAALDFIDSKAASVGYAAMNKDPSLFGYMPAAKINANFDMTTDEWSETTAVNSAHAADMGIDCTLLNNGFASASGLTPTLDVVVGSTVVQSVSPADAVAELAAGGAHTFHVNAVPLSLNELKSVQSGAPVSLRLNQVEADVMVPQVEGGTVVYKDLGKWSPYASSIENWCARVTVDMGDGTYATYPVLAQNARGSAPPVTLLDAMLWTLGEYEDGSYSRLNVPAFLPDSGKSQPVPSFGDWMFVFDKGYSQTEISGYDSLLDVRLKAGTHVLVKAPNSKGDRPSIPWATIAPSGGETEITNATGKAVSVAVDADMAVGRVWVADSSTAGTSTWVELADPDQDGIYTASLPKSWRCISGRPQVIAESAVRWGSGAEATGTTMVPAKTSAPTGLTGQLSGTVTSFPSDTLGISKQIVAFDFEGNKARVLKHGDWDSPPKGTDLSTWVYSTKESHYVPTGDAVDTIVYHGFFEVYGSSTSPKWMGKTTDWFDTSKRKTLKDIKSAKSKVSWSKPKSGIQEISWGAPFETNDTILLRTKGGSWVKCQMTEYSYHSEFINGAGTAKTTKKVACKYTIFDPGQ